MRRRQRLWLMSAVVVAAIVTLALYLRTLNEEPLPRTPDPDELLLYDVLDAIEKLTTLLERDSEGINVDGLFGIRLYQGSTVQALDDCSMQGFHCPSGLTRRLETVNKNMDATVERAIPSVREQDVSYFKFFQGIISAPYKITYIPETLEKFNATIGVDTVFRGEISDVCFSLLQGTYVSNGKTSNKCSVNDKCKDFVTKEDAGGYYVTHQLLYTMFGEKFGCVEMLEQLMAEKYGYTLRAQQRKLCARIYTEAIANNREDSGMDPLTHHDLFIEQSLLCGLLGFQEFFQRPWMRLILSWQSPSGCYTLPENSLLKLKAQLEGNKQVKAASRKLLREHLMRDNCLSHATALALGTMGAYVRHLVQHVYS